MLKWLRIRGFRGFKDLRIDGLSRINLMAGANKAGKTTLLEAVVLLGAAGGDPCMAMNPLVVRAMQSKAASPTSIWETVWKPLFFDLDTDGAITISGRHSAVGDMTLEIMLERSVTTEISRVGEGEKLLNGHTGERSLKFKYRDRTGKIESEAREAAENVTFERKDPYAPYSGAIIQPGSGNIREDAILLGRLRKEKRGDLLLQALRVFEPGLQGVEDNSSSGAPMIWVDVGLRELVPLPVMGSGMTQVARMVLMATAARGGVLLIDEIENGLHHSVVPDVWRVVAKVAEQCNVQIFATTHSFECVEAAHEALGAEGFRLHRLEAVDGERRCVTLSPIAIAGAIRHNLEIR